MTEFVALGTAEALVMVGAGSTYRDAALVAPSTRRPGVIEVWRFSSSAMF
jgi:hypothetical protein